MKKIAFISDHASPLATLGGIDAGGQNVYVAEVARQLAKGGVEVDVYTRWDDPGVPQIVEWRPGIRVIHIQAGEVARVQKENLYAFMGEFAQRMIDFILENNITYDICHAHFWMSAMVA